MRFQFLTKIYYLNEKNMNEETTKTDIPYRTKKTKVEIYNDHFENAKRY
jgi:hypothetical protein